MSAAIASVAPVLVAVFILIAGNGMLTTLVPLRGSLEGFTPSTLGVIGSAYFLGMLAGTWIAPAIVRRAGHIRAFAAMAAIAAAAALGFAIFIEPAVWIVLRGVVGLCFGGLYAIIEGWINAKSNDSNRGRMLGLYNVVNFTGSAAGQQCLKLAAPNSFALFSGAAAFLMLALVPMAMTRAEPPPIPAKGRLQILALFRTSPVAAIGILFVGLANGSMWSLTPAYIERMQLGTAVVASFMTALILGSAAGPYPFGRLSDLVDRRVVIACISLAATLVEIALALAGTPAVGLLYALGFGLGLLGPVLYPLIGAHANDRRSEVGAVHMSSTLLFIYCVGGIVGPSIASHMMMRFGDGMLFVHNAAVHAALALYVIWRILRQAPARRAAEVEPVSEVAGGVTPTASAG